ncbi:MAG: twin-arginine translocase TatA/TatE family subunit [Candidatus Lambdaproteobacteria bacterium]|nr:twin-arginine translocase TatA/TatE family subunit [Candidatus Lambdaproteobacteria bacterium]
MLGGLGIQELLVILVIVVVLFGATRLPQLGEGLGKAIGNFRRSIKDGGSEDEEKAKPSENKKIPHS